MHEPGNAPAPADLLLTAREALKRVLREPQHDHTYTILMAMNAMGIAARAMRAAALDPVQAGISDAALARRLRHADATALHEGALLADLERHVAARLAVANPRFEPEPDQEQP